MIVIRFPDTESKRRALGFLAGRFSFKSWASGEIAVPEAALAHLATENIPFSVEGQATYERLISTVRDPVDGTRSCCRESLTTVSPSLTN